MLKNYNRNNLPDERFEKLHDQAGLHTQPYVFKIKHIQLYGAND